MNKPIFRFLFYFMLNLSFLTPVQAVALTHLEDRRPTAIKNKEDNNAHNFATPSSPEGGGNALTSSFYNHHKRRR